MTAPYDSFAEIYDQWSSEMTEDVPFYVELGRQADGPIVELGVGTGRVAIPVAEATGRTVIGIDASPAMLSRARGRADAAGVALDLREADMRGLELDTPAALVYSPARSLLHLPTWADRRTLFERVARALVPGGRFAWNAFVFDFRVAAKVEGHHDEGLTSHTVRHSPTDNRLDIALDRGGEISLWWVTRSEWEGLIELGGLEVEALYGWFDRRPFDEDSREFVWVARKPG